MATIVNNPPATNTSENNTSLNWLFAIIFLVVLFFLIVYFLLPVVRRANSVPQVSVPDKIDVNVNTPNQ